MTHKLNRTHFIKFSTLNLILLYPIWKSQSRFYASISSLKSESVIELKYPALQLSFLNQFQ